MKPDIYYDTPFEEYLKWKAVSASKLSLFAKSPAHYQAGYKPATRALTLGSLIHAGVLESDSLAKRYAVVPNYHLDGPDADGEGGNVDTKGKRSRSKATKYYKEKVRDFSRGLPSEVEIVSQESYDKMQGVVDAILACPKAAKLLSAGKVEVSMLWKDPETGLMCKGRIDLLEGWKFVDLKTTNSIASFQHAIRKYGYHRQMAWYQWGLRVLTGETCQPNIVAVETDVPYSVAAAPMSPLALEHGLDECRSLLRGIADCEFLGVWGGVESPEAWELPE